MGCPCGALVAAQNGLWGGVSWVSCSTYGTPPRQHSQLAHTAVDHAHHECTGGPQPGWFGWGWLGGGREGPCTVRARPVFAAHGHSVHTSAVPPLPTCRRPPITSPLRTGPEHTTYYERARHGNRAIQVFRKSLFAWAPGRPFPNPAPLALPGAHIGTPGERKCGLVSPLALREVIRHTWRSRMRLGKLR